MKNVRPSTYRQALFTLISVLALTAAACKPSGPAASSTATAGSSASATASARAARLSALQNIVEARVLTAGAWPAAAEGQSVPAGGTTATSQLTSYTLP